MSKEPILIDATNLILGRMASYLAKRALAGDDVVVLNAEKAVISGKKRALLEDTSRRLGTRTLASQATAPVHPRRPDTYVRRVVRGMLPWKKPRGKTAFKRVKVYTGVPEEFREKTLQRLPEADASKLRCPYVTVGELASEIGGLSNE